MDHSKTRGETCTACEAREVHHRRVSANGGYGPRLLEGLGRLFKPAKLDVYLCAACGHVEFFADEATRERVRETLGVEVSLVDLFRHPTVGSLARRLTAEEETEEETESKLDAARSRGRRMKEALRGRRGEPAGAES